jgi:hypothetical protein
MKRLATLFAVLFSLSAASVWACPGDKAKDDGKQSTPKKPSTSLAIDSGNDQDHAGPAGQGRVSSHSSMPKALEKTTVL